MNDVAEEPRSRISGKGTTGGVDKLQRRKNAKSASDPVLGIQTTQTGAQRHQNAPKQTIVGNVDQEGNGEMGNPPIKDMGSGLVAGSLKDESTAGDIGLHPPGTETDEIIGPVLITRLKILLMQKPHAGDL